MELIDRQAAIDALLSITKFKTRRELVNRCDASIADSEGWLGGVAECINEIYDLPSAEPKTSRIEQEIHGKTPEEQYDFIYWLLLKFGLGYTDSRLAILEWLRGEDDER